MVQCTYYQLIAYTGMHVLHTYMCEHICKYIHTDCTFTYVCTYVRTMKDMSVPEEQNPNPVLSCVMEVIALNVPAAATHRRSREGHRHMHFSTIFILTFYYYI